MFSFGLNSPVNMNVKSSFYDEPVTQEGLLRRWELIKESKKVRKQENTLSTKKATKKKQTITVKKKRKKARFDQ